MNIMAMGKEEILQLNPDDIDRKLKPKEVVHIAKVLGAFWSYDYEAAKKSIPGLHAELKSKRHSDGFFVSRIMLQYENILKIMAGQLALCFNELGIPKPKKLAGIPTGATKLGKEVGKILKVEMAKMDKVEGVITLTGDLLPDETLLLVEDFCTRGTAFYEAVEGILLKHPDAKILPVSLVILNRGGLSELDIPGINETFRVVAAVDYRINDWTAEECPLCNDFGSKPIKPKTTDENWGLITTSQS